MYMDSFHASPAIEPIVSTCHFWRDCGGGFGTEALLDLDTRLPEQYELGLACSQRKPSGARESAQKPAFPSVGPVSLGCLPSRSNKTASYLAARREWPAVPGLFRREDVNASLIRPRGRGVAGRGSGPDAHHATGWRLSRLATYMSELFRQHPETPPTWRANRLALGRELRGRNRMSTTHAANRTGRMPDARGRRERERGLRGLVGVSSSPPLPVLPPTHPI